MCDVLSSQRHIDTNANYIRVEVAVKRIISGIEVQPSSSVANADCLKWYQQWAETH